MARIRDSKTQQYWRESGGGSWDNAEVRAVGSEEELHFGERAGSNNALKNRQQVSET
jgi:hypothetical protein